VKIAPTLAGLFCEKPHATHIPEYAAARRELRALLVAFRAADRTHNHAYLDAHEESRCSFCRAKGRLERLSAPPRRARAAKGART
jgi:hypothetical protein